MAHSAAGGQLSPVPLHYRQLGSGAPSIFLHFPDTSHPHLDKEWIQIVVYFAALLARVKPLGSYMAAIYCKQVMKVLAIMSTISLPAIVISGFFGMNLKQMPFSDNPYGPIIVIGMKVSVTVSLLILLRRMRWI